MDNKLEMYPRGVLIYLLLSFNQLIEEYQEHGKFRNILYPKERKNRFDAKALGHVPFIFISYSVCLSDISPCHFVFF